MIPEKLVALDAGATVGPWTAEAIGPAARYEGQDWCVMAAGYRIIEDVTEADARLIAVSRTLLPLLIGLWRATRHEIFGVVGAPPRQPDPDSDDEDWSTPADWLHDLEDLA